MHELIIFFNRVNEQTGQYARKFLWHGARGIKTRSKRISNASVAEKWIKMASRILGWKSRFYRFAEWTYYYF